MKIFILYPSYKILIKLQNSTYVSFSILNSLQLK